MTLVVKISSGLSLSLWVSVQVQLGLKAEASRLQEPVQTTRLL